MNPHGMFAATIAACACAFAVAADARQMAHGLESRVPPALRQALDARMSAVDRQDAEALGRLLAADYMGLSAAGVRQDREARLVELRREAPPAAPRVRTEEALRLYGDAAVRRVKTARARQVELWVRRGDAWLLAMAHQTPDVAPPPAPPVPGPDTPEPSRYVPPPGLSVDEASAFAAHKALQDAFFKGDIAEGARLTAPEYVRILPGGAIRFGDEGQGEAGRRRGQPVPDEVTVRVFGSAAVVRWRESRPNGTHMWLSRVLVRLAGRWMQVAVSSTPAAAAPGSPAAPPPR